MKKQSCIMLISAITLSLGMAMMSCGSGEKVSPVDSAVVYDSAMCEQLVAIPGYEMTPEQYSQMVEQAIIIADMANAEMQDIISQDLNPESEARFRAMMRKKSFQQAQHFYGELFIDMDAQKIPADVRERAQIAQAKTKQMQETFEMMFMSLSGSAGNAGDPSFYEQHPESPADSDTPVPPGAAANANPL